ncbi:uncharacterized protein MYCFIDRAFT_29878 [Pseudocercospora fijiensis CIRAD86]|uniref:NAD(P)-binding protein n=1 Tax=Pseudocercospora fijiensis (strain CIRAD86) TaxID=383855 RepID=M3AQD9_PSEFD|nr:uncharacterized protein MYCFIDRAFT_29878 [Pseudocercospora fijiensis CIRAD86]EME86816.1 hypothetical protein MYCFIDRAFT_29878 [Pseudocercospora fijiensis CIRAD86]
MSGPSSSSADDFILSLPPWSGSRFTYPHINHSVPPSLDPSKNLLPQPFTAIVTGASRGIGAATAKCLARAGATGLIITARKLESLSKTKEELEEISKEIKVVAIAADNAQETSAIEIKELVEKEFDGKLDLLINNAGIVSTNETAFKPLHEMDSSQFEIPITTNLFGRFYMIKHLLPCLLSSPRPTKSIINISSVGGNISGPLAFSLSALATNRLSQRVAESYGKDGVFCVAVHPGAVLPKDEDIPPGFPESVKEWSQDEPGLCGSFIVDLVRREWEEREWLNGRYLDVTWDMEELYKKKEEVVEGDKLRVKLVV